MRSAFCRIEIGDRERFRGRVKLRTQRRMFSNSEDISSTARRRRRNRTVCAAARGGATRGASARTCAAEKYFSGSRDRRKSEKRKSQKSRSAFRCRKISARLRQTRALAAIFPRSFLISSCCRLLVFASSSMKRLTSRTNVSAAISNSGGTMNQEPPGD